MRAVYHRVFLATLLFGIPLFVSFSAFANAPSTDNIEDLLGIMESPTKREAFTKNLKNLLEARKAMESKKAAGRDERLFIIRLVFDQLDRISRDLQKEAIAWGLMVEELPEAFSQMKSFFLETKHRPHLRILFLDVAAAFLAMLICVYFFRYPIRAATARMKDLPTRIGWGVVYILLKALPFSALFIVFNIMFRVFPSFSKGRTIVLLLFTLLFLYQLIMAAFHTLLSPENAHGRLASISDENANYLWIWVRRFALYAFFYFMTTRSLLWTQGPQLYFAYLRGLLLLPFPLMLNVFVFQLAREIRLKHREPPGTENGLSGQAAHAEDTKNRSRIISGLLGGWPFLATGYIWTIFLSLMVKYEKGFEYLFRATLGTALTGIVIFILFYALETSFRHFFQIKEQTRRRFPGLEQRANRYLLIVKNGLKIVVVIAGLGVVGQIWGIPVSTFVASDIGAMIIFRAIAIAFTVAVIAGIIEINNILAGYLLKEKRGGRKREVSQKQKTLVPVMQTAANIAAGFVGESLYWNDWGSTPLPSSQAPGFSDSPWGSVPRHWSRTSSADSSFCLRRAFAWETGPWWEIKADPWNRWVSEPSN